MTGRQLAVDSVGDDEIVGAVRATVVNVQRFSTEDGPGLRTTVFLKGCPMRCPWCHNPETIGFPVQIGWESQRCIGDRGCIAVCGRGALAAVDGRISIDAAKCRACGACAAFCPPGALIRFGQELDIGELFDWVARDKMFYEKSGGGVTLSGGEPMAQPDAALALLRMLKNAGIHGAVDTCGIMNASAMRQMTEVADLVLLDLKTMDPVKHVEWTGYSVERVIECASFIGQTDIPMWVRTPVIPGYTDAPESVRSIAALIRNRLPNCRRYELLAFSRLCESKYRQLDLEWAMNGAPLVETARMQTLCEAARNEWNGDVRWSGMSAPSPAGAGP